MERVGSYEAKTHLAQLLERVSKGEKIMITRHGVPIAVLQPAEGANRKPVRETIERLKAFSRGKRLGRVSLKSMIEEGRK